MITHVGKLVDSVPNRYFMSFKHYCHLPLIKPFTEIEKKWLYGIEGEMPVQHRPGCILGLEAETWSWFETGPGSHSELKLALYLTFFNTTQS